MSHDLHCFFDCVLMHFMFTDLNFFHYRSCMQRDAGGSAQKLSVMVTTKETIIYFFLNANCHKIFFKCLKYVPSIFVYICLIPNNTGYRVVT